jgi:hypothetical protein
MALLSAGVALAPAMCPSPAFGLCGCEGLAGESFPFLVPFLPLLTSCVAVFQALCFLANVSNQDININCQGAMDDTRSGQELRGKSCQLVWDASENGTFVFLVYNTHTRGH